MPDFAVIGLGSVGWAVVHGLHSQGYSYAGFDVKDQYDWKAVLDTKIAFICTSTPMSDKGRLDSSSIDNVLERLNLDGYWGVTVVKSTIPVGFMEQESGKYPNLRLVYMPEFLRERNSYTWFVDPDRIVAAGREEDVNDVLRYFNWAKGTEIIRTDFRSAEIGKLAHNSYIATKVSFTNEMERISREFSGNPRDVMRIVWTDRRIQHSDHLTPGLGPYAGKCVLKDTNELIEHTSSEFLKSVRDVNDRCTSPETETIYDPVHVIIPANDRPFLLKKALESVSRQTYLPCTIGVVTDSGAKAASETEEILDTLRTIFPIRHIINEGIKNVSGAVNTALKDLSRALSFCENSFIAILDDDDLWDRRYLENCAKFAYETKADWIISGLIRHDEEHPDGFMQNIPSNLSVSDFLVGNPNIQNSNLFVRANALISIGGFDETLASTTDRDVCIRLYQSGTRYAILFNHLVHHEAFARSDRLSCPGSPRKKAGLMGFYQKYNTIMSSEQRTAFRERAKTLFAIEIPEVS